MFLTIVIFVAILVVLILIHEFGHFVAAKLNKVRVEEFAFGFPLEPSIMSQVPEWFQVMVGSGTIGSLEI